MALRQPVTTTGSPFKTAPSPVSLTYMSLYENIIKYSFFCLSSRPSSAILSSMNDFPARDSLHIDPRLEPLLMAAAPLDFAITHGVRLAAKGVLAAKNRIDRAVYLRHAATRAAETSTPSPTDVADAWQIPHVPRTPAAALLLGDQLLAVEAPSAALHQIGPDGHCHLVSRGGGLKEWLHNAAPNIPYSTATRYRRLAAHLRQWLQLPPEIPISWLFPTAPSPSSLTSSAPLRHQIASARRAFTDLLADYPSLARLQRRLETDLGLLALRCGVDHFTSYRDLDGIRDTPPPPVAPPKWHPTQTLLNLSALSQHPKTARRRRRRPRR